MLRALIVPASFVLQALIYRYLWRRLIRDTGLTGRNKTIATVVLIAFGLSVPLAVAIRRFYRQLSSDIVPAILWVGVFTTMLCVFLLLLDGVRALRARLQTTNSSDGSESESAKEDEVDVSRRAFLSRVAGGGAAASALAVQASATHKALRTPPLRRQEFTLKRLPPALDGFSLALITDLHIGNSIGRDYVERVVKQTNRAKPDAIVITGDLIDGSVDDLREDAAPLAKLSAPQGVYFVTGNHEYYQDVDSWLAHLPSLGMRVLRNERVALGRDGHSFDLLGIDDRWAYRHAGHGADLAAACAGRDPSREAVLLAHQPRQVEQAREHGIGLQLSGHTHGGQIWPIHYIARASQKGFLAGRYRIGDTQLYVSRGTGYVAAPIRLLASSEITHVILRADPNTNA